VLYYAYFIYFYAIFGLGRTGISFIASMVWSSTLLMRPSTNGESDWQRACVQMDNILNTFYKLLMTAKKNHGQIKCNIWSWFVCQKDVPLLLTLCDFQVPKVSQGKIRTVKKINHLSIAYSFTSICTKNYENRQLLLKLSLVVGRYIFFETQFTLHIRAPPEEDKLWSQTTRSES